MRRRGGQESCSSTDRMQKNCFGSAVSTTRECLSLRPKVTYHNDQRARFLQTGSAASNPSGVRMSEPHRSGHWRLGRVRGIRQRRRPYSGRFTLDERHPEWMFDDESHSNTEG